MSIVYKILFFITLGVVMVIAWAHYKRKSSATNNRLVALDWFEKMDLVSDGQRYRGERSQIVLDFGSGPLGAFGYQLVVGCTTQSGRAYYLRIVSLMCVVTDWSIISADLDDFDLPIQDEAQGTAQSLVTTPSPSTSIS